MSIQLYLPPTRYVVASLPLTDYRAAVECLHEAATDAESFVSLIRDKQEVTLMVAEDYWQNLSSQFPNAQARGDWRMIRFDTVMDFSVVGFIAEVSRALAEADVCILSISTYSTDAVLVHESQFDAAVTAVKQALMTIQYTILARH
ncbi:MAG TPA: ACT domain-containing protein [Blastocatellia bacterium]|nr:ACT domain-containing protein [Blastocatellia bacterium]HMX24300.1 ACT domain-containing protein [Blastocatellia bacterium]HMY72914.1 ACT domain-containing protein [Blastocatellia bacterium]HMZ20584.1 ACT domain-containing protein [Blastocatellia bacterium]